MKTKATIFSLSTEADHFCFVFVPFSILFFLSKNRYVKKMTHTIFVALLRDTMMVLESKV